MIEAPTFIIGGFSSREIIPGNTHYIGLPGAQFIGSASARIYNYKTLPELLNALRYEFGQHSAVTSLAGATIIDDLPIAPELENTRKEWSLAIQNQLANLFEGLGNCPADSWEGAKNIISNGETIAKSTHSGHFFNALERVPAICLAAGPSAQQYLPQLERLQDSHAIFTCDAMLNACVDHGIVPQYVTALERVPFLYKFFERSASSGTTLIAPPVLHPSAFNCFNNQSIMWWAPDDIYRWIDPNVIQATAGRSAGTLSVAAALHAGCNPIYLVGHDLAYKDGKTHADSFTRVLPPEEYKITSTIDPYYMQHRTPKNGGGDIDTTGAWQMFRADIELIISMYPGRSVVNINRDEGAVINGTSGGWLPLGGLGGIVSKPRLPASGIADIRLRIPSIRADLDKLEYAARGYADAIESAETRKDLDLIARGLAVGSIVSKENVWLFRYALRNIYHSLRMRMYLRQDEGTFSQASALRILTRTIPGMCNLMRRELP